MRDEAIQAKVNILPNPGLAPERGFATNHNRDTTNHCYDLHSTRRPLCFKNDKPLFLLSTLCEQEKNIMKRHRVIVVCTTHIVA